MWSDIMGIMLRDFASAFWCLRKSVLGTAPYFGPGPDPAGGGEGGGVRDEIKGPEKNSAVGQDPRNLGERKRALSCSVLYPANAVFGGF